MKKIFAVGLAAALALTVFAGCGETENNNNNNANNTAPTIEGVKVQDTIMAGEEWNALEGVTATDKEDGDLTSKIEVSANGLTFTNGKTTPTEADALGYEVIYTVKDSGGKTATEYCTLIVKEAAGELINVFEADFSDITPKYDWAEGNEGEGNNHFWKPTIEKAEATAALKNGAFVFDVTDLKDAGDGDVRLARTFNDLEAGTYQFVIWASSTVETYVHLIAEDASTDDWKTPGGKWNVKVGTKLAAYTTGEFELKEGDTKSLEFRIHMGKITPNPDEPTDTSASAFSLAIEKITIFKTTGVDHETDLYNKAQFDDVAGLEVTNQGDGAAAAASYDAASKAAKIDITKYNTEGGIWSISAKLPLTGVHVETGDRYGYEVVMSATAAFSGEMPISTDNKDAEEREFVNIAVGTTDTKISGTFTAKFTTDAAFIHFQLGDKRDNSLSVTSNTILIKSVRFFKIEGDKKTDKFQDKFILFGDAAPDKTNPKYPISVYNQSDDVFDAAPTGTAYFENNKLVYLIHQGGTDQGHNKLAFGFWDNPIGPLPANAYYVISFKIKASVAIDFSLTLHDMEMGWDEAAGGIPIRYADFGGHELLHAGTEEKTIEISSADVSLAAHNKCELLIEFGKFLGTNKDVKIEISDLKIGYRTVQV